MQHSRNPIGVSEMWSVEPDALTRVYGDENLKDVALWIPVANPTHEHSMNTKQTT
jgi:hypothetical protein